MTRKPILLTLLGIAFLALSFGSCKKFEGSQKVPAYIHIDSITLECDYSQYGANTSKITETKRISASAVIDSLQISRP